MALARSENSSQRFYSMSAQIRQERAAYYHILEQTQKANMDITPWMEWFLGCLGRAIDGAQTVLSTVLAKARSWERMKGVAINDHQRLVLNRLLDEFRRHAHDNQICKTHKVFAGHGPARSRASG
jgi:Fic family protein